MRFFKRFKKRRPATNKAAGLVVKDHEGNPVFGITGSGEILRKTL